MSNNLFPGVAVLRCFLWYFLSLKGTSLRAQPHHSARRSRRVRPQSGQWVCARVAHQRAFRSPFGNLRTPKVARNPWDVKSHSLAVVGAPIPPIPFTPILPPTALSAENAPCGTPIALRPADDRAPPISRFDPPINSPLIAAVKRQCQIPRRPAAGRRPISRKGPSPGCCAGPCE